MVAKIIENLEISKWVGIAYRWVGLAYTTVQCTVKFEIFTYIQGAPFIMYTAKVHLCKVKILFYTTCCKSEFFNLNFFSRGCSYNKKITFY